MNYTHDNLTTKEKIILAVVLKHNDYDTMYDYNECNGEMSLTEAGESFLKRCYILERSYRIPFTVISYFRAVNAIKEVSNYINIDTNDEKILQLHLLDECDFKVIGKNCVLTPMAVAKIIAEDKARVEQQVLQTIRKQNQINGIER